ncbi:MAG: sterol desaturase family protein [Pseudobdellovibrionaceae bacterium]
MQVFWPEAHPSIVLGAVLVTYTFFHYWSHRLRHQVDFFWRTTHQMHHSPNRFDLSLSVYVHPFDVAFITLVIVGSTMLVAGFSPEYFGMVGLMHVLLDKPAHLNVKTPLWLGHFIYRPEQHSLHHETHDNNYGLIPLWDKLFGTFKDCEHQAPKIGFANLRTSNFWDILLCKKVG